MFDSAYPFQFIQYAKPNADDLYIRKHIYRFKGKNGIRYIVEAEEYIHHLFAIKFYANSHAHRPDKFEIKLGQHDMVGVVGTCLAIMANIAAELPNASFVAIGVASGNEAKTATQRYRIYDLLFRNIFGHVNYAQYRNASNSVLMVLHRSLLERQLFDEVKALFLQYFDISI